MMVGCMNKSNGTVNVKTVVIFLLMFTCLF